MAQATGTRFKHWILECRSKHWITARFSEADARAIAELLVAIWPKPGRTVDTLHGRNP